MMMPPVINCYNSAASTAAITGCSIIAATLFLLVNAMANQFRKMENQVRKSFCYRYGPITLDSEQFLTNFFYAQFSAVEPGSTNRSHHFFAVRNV